MEEHTLEIGSAVVVSKSVLRGSISVIYAGMLSDTCYSIAVKWLSGNQAMAYNLYLSPDQRRVALPRGYLSVSSVKPNLLRFQYMP